MGKNTFVATIQSTGESKSYTINVIDIEFVNGYWTSDKEGKEILEKSKLGETVYFHVELKGLADGQEIQLSLAEYDYNNGAAFFLGSSKLLQDVLDPDDRKFPEEEVIKKATVKNDKATVELLLHESWEGMIKDDHEEWFSLNESIELYWEVSYNNKYKTELPNDNDNYLLVGQNDRTLYIKPFDYGYNMPEFFDYNGNPLAYMQVSPNTAIDPQLKNDIEKEHAKQIIDKGVDRLKDKIQGAILDGIENSATQVSSKIALARFDKATLSTSKNPFSHLSQNDYYTHDPKIIEQLKDKKNWDKIIKGNNVRPLEYYSNTGVKMQALGILKNIGENVDTVTDLFDLFKFGVDDLDFSNPMSFPGIGALGPVGTAFSLVNGVAGMLVKQLKDEQDAFLEESIQQDVNKAKLLGLEATRQEINTWNHNEEFRWRLKSFYPETVNKFLQGEFETLDDLIYFDSNIIDGLDKNITILYRRMENKNKEETVDVVESIFINE